MQQRVPAVIKQKKSMTQGGYIQTEMELAFR